MHLSWPIRCLKAHVRAHAEAYVLHWSRDLTWIYYFSIMYNHLIRIALPFWTNTLQLLVQKCVTHVSAMRKPCILTCGLNIVIQVTTTPCKLLASSFIQMISSLRIPCTTSSHYFLGWFLCYASSISTLWRISSNILPIYDAYKRFYTGIRAVVPISPNLSPPLRTCALFLLSVIIPKRINWKRKLRSPCAAT